MLKRIRSTRDCRFIAADVLHSYALGQKPHELGTDPPEVTAAIVQFCQPLRAS